jgi:hypothetical protein
LEDLASRIAGLVDLRLEVAIAFHIRARDFGRNLFVNATGMLVICVATALFCFIL